MNWTEGRALIGTGSPFRPADWNGQKVPIGQTNNSYIFPGVGLGVLASEARRITDAMFMVAARTLADLSPAAKTPGGPLLPPVDQLRSVARTVAGAVARQAMADGVAEQRSDADIDALIDAHVWEPVYRPYHYVPIPIKAEV